MFHHGSKESISFGVFKITLLFTVMIVMTVIGLSIFLSQQLRWGLNFVITLTGFIVGVVWVKMMRLLIASYRMDKFVAIVEQLECHPDLKCLFWNTYAFPMLTTTLSHDADFIKGYRRFKKLFPPR